MGHCRVFVEEVVVVGELEVAAAVVAAVAAGTAAGLN